MQKQPHTHIEATHAQPQSSLISSAFPISKPPRSHSISHKILQQSTQTLQHQSFRNFKPEDVIEIRHLQLQWFPLVYGDYFYKRLLKQEYQCLVSEREVLIEWGKLKTILKQKYNQEQNIYQSQIQQMDKAKLDFARPSQYFVSQGIAFENLDLENPEEIIKCMKSKSEKKNELSDGKNIEVDFQSLAQPPETLKQALRKSETPQNKSTFNLIKIKIITGILVFDRALSNGHLGGVFWSEIMLGENTSIYINTLGVLAEFRKTGLACRMLDWLIKTIQKQTSFKFVYLHVIDYNIAAIKLYKKMGFEYLETVPDYYNIDNMSYKAELLGLFVNGGKKKVGWRQWVGSFWR